jgi:hypothetical protein
MSSWLISVPGTNSVMYAAFQGTLQDEDKTDLWTPSWPGGNRGRKTERDFTHDGGYWPSAPRMGFICDPGAGNAFDCLWDSQHTHGDYEAWSYGRGGQQGQKFIMGRCKDSNGTGVGAIVAGFLTANDQYVGEVTAGSDGYYEFGTTYVATNHYLVAYAAGSPDKTGATVNTLQGTNRDGT